MTRTWARAPGVGPRVMLVHRRGPGDPSYRLEGGVHWRGLRTPEGLVTLRVDDNSAEAWGPGSAWVLDRVPRMMGAEDDPAGFEPDLPILRERARHGIPRLGASDLVMDALLPAIIEQKVTGQEAFGAFRRLLKRYGDPAPGPHPELRVQPDAATLRSIPSWEWLRLPVDHARSRTIVTAARVADSLERTVGHPSDVVEQRLRSVAGIGEWTAAEVRQRAHGDPDAVSFGDYHVAKDAGWAIAGELWSDDQLREFLEPYRPHRGRVIALLGGSHRPRHGPRMAPRSHLPR